MRERAELTTRMDAPRMSGAPEKKRRISETCPATFSPSPGTDRSMVMCSKAGRAVASPGTTAAASKAMSTTVRLMTITRIP